MATKKQALQMQKKPDAVVLKEEDDRPVIAWDEMSILDTLEMTKRSDEGTYINVISAKIHAGVATDEDWVRLDYLRSSDYQVGVIEKQAEDMAKYVSYVPRHWFKKSAPDDLDFDSADTFKLLQPQRFIQLYQKLLMTDAQAEAVSGN